MKAVTRSPILDALDAESHEYLGNTAPELLSAIESEIASGMRPDAIRRLVAAHVGSDRQALAVRCLQAARHAARMQRG